MKISKRLQLIGNLVPKDSIVLDLGTDHAFLPIYLSQNNITSTIYASDNKKGPCDIAMRRLEQYGLKDKIPVILSNGLANIEQKVDCLVIAGMGGELIIDILKDDIAKVKNIQTLILQPNGHEYQLRKFLQENELYIVSELLIYERGYKAIIKAEHGKMCLSESQMKYGPLIIEEGSPLFQKRLIYDLHKYSKLMAIAPDERKKEELDIIEQLIQKYK